MNSLIFDVRAATDSDAGQVRAFVVPIMEEFGLGLDPDGADRDLYDIGAGYSDRGGWLELVIRDGGLVGTVGMVPVEEGVIELRKMYLLAEVRGLGLGNALLARSIDRARLAGYREIALETATVLKSAIGLYRRFGFIRDTGDYPRCGKRACDQVWRLSLADYRPPETTMPVLRESKL